MSRILFIFILSLKSDSQVISDYKMSTHTTDARAPEDQTNSSAAAAVTTPTGIQAVFPRYDVPFDKENIKDFFTFRKGVVDTAIQECITGLLFPEDGEYLGSWLLTE